MGFRVTDGRVLEYNAGPVSVRSRRGRPLLRASRSGSWSVFVGLLLAFNQFFIRFLISLVVFNRFLLSLYQIFISFFY